MQAMKRGETERALDLARRAYRLRPKSDWVAGVLFDLDVRGRRWLDARVAADEAARRGLMPPEISRRRRAVLALELGRDAEARGDAEEALRHAREAHELAPDFVPAALVLADGWIKLGKGRRAVAMIERVWRAAPHADLVPLYWLALGTGNALERMRATQRLVNGSPDHLESRLALATAALEAKLWGEARRALASVGDNPPARVCRLMAALDEQERGDLNASRAWLMRASLADPDPAWVCDACGHAVKEWGALCAKCHGFDSFRWRTPPHVAGLTGPAPVAPPTVLTAGVNGTSRSPAND
jgi:HemY protein